MLQFAAAGWKPVLTALLLPPVPLLLLMLLGAGVLRRRPAWGWLLLLSGAAGIWLGSTTAVGLWLQRQLLQPPDVLRLDAAYELLGRVITAQATMLGFRDAFLVVAVDLVHALVDKLIFLIDLEQVKNIFHPFFYLYFYCKIAKIKARASND